MPCAARMRKIATVVAWRWESRGSVRQIFRNMLPDSAAAEQSASYACFPWQNVAQTQTDHLFKQAIYWHFCRGQSTQSKWALSERQGGPCPAGDRSPAEPPCSSLFSCMGSTSLRCGFAVDKMLRNNSHCLLSSFFSVSTVHRSVVPTVSGASMRVRFCSVALSEHT